MPASVRFRQIGGDEADSFDDPTGRRQFHKPYQYVVENHS
jgi:hypothetical protein